MAVIVHGDRWRPTALRPGRAAAAASRWRTSACNAELRARIEELRASRARIVKAGDQQRRRLERDLHDGAQQRLVALALNLRLRAAKLDTDPAAAKELLDETAEELAQATERAARARARHAPRGPERPRARPALEALAGRAPMPVEVGEPPESGCPRRSSRPPTSSSPRR